MYKSAAWPLSLVYAAIVVYASLYPFVDWRDQGIAPWGFLASPLPRYWTAFDVVINMIGYGPLGFLLALAASRSSYVRPASFAILVAALLSLAMEMLQSYLPARFPSNLDLGLNALGAAAGALVCMVLQRLGWINRWSHFRSDWLVPQPQDGLVLLALWPAALMFPPAVPLGLGQVFERLEGAVFELLSDTPLLEMLPWRELELQPLLPTAELVCVALGLWVPCLLGIGIVRTRRRRLVLVLLTVLMGIFATALSATLSYGPGYSWSWLSPGVQAGLVLGTLLAVISVWLPAWVCASLAAASLCLSLLLLNLSPAGPYLTQTLQTWEQGRFIRFHGLAQWLGWLWPYAALAYAVAHMAPNGGKSKMNA
ncbi:MAG: hypothetical protein RJA34_2093 [Pseudomonadota bacterium]|jgi:VanZ family protein